MTPTVLKMRNYATEDGRLIDLIDAEFFARRIAVGTEIDLTGITSIEPEYLGTLLKDVAPESFTGQIRTDSPAVERVVKAWRERKRAQVPSLTPSGGAAPAPADDEVPTEGVKRYTPERLIRRMSTALRGYIESSTPLSDPLLVSARRRLLDEGENGHLLSQEPYIETTPRYEMSDRGYEQLGLPAAVAGLFARLSRQTRSASQPGEERPILFPTIYRHQAEAYRQFISEGRDIVVATGTGSGKTECFLLPILASLYREAAERPESFRLPGVRALILYPMNALVNDQLARLRLLFGDRHLTAEFKQVGTGKFPRFGMYTGRTPYPGPRRAEKDKERVAPLLRYYLDLKPEVRERLRQLGRYPAKDLSAFYRGGEAVQRVYQSGANAGRSYTNHNWSRRLHTSPDDRELLTRHEMVNGTGTEPGHSPEILVTNYSMLEYMLMRPFERPIFAEMREWLAQDGNRLTLVIDEAHLYRGAVGAEVAFLIRRLQARLGIHHRPEKLQIVATSASLGSGPEEGEQIVNFVADLTGKAPGHFVTINGRRSVPEPAAAGSAAECRMLAQLELGAINEAENVEALRTALAPVFYHYHAPLPDGGEDELLAGLYDVLKDRPFVNQLIAKASSQAQSLPTLAVEVFGQDAQAAEALASLLTIGTLARSGSGEVGLFPSRIHAIFRGLQGLYACLNPCCRGRQAGPGERAALGKLFTAPRISCDECGARVFEIASCRKCGTPYLQAYAHSGTLQDLNFLWGETEGELEMIQLLPVPPRSDEWVGKIQVHLRTGLVLTDEAADQGQKRELYLSSDEKGQRQPLFKRCAICQPHSASRARIFDLRTKGEGPFTALIEAQFAEQPPQKNDPSLPNRGRKVLVFSDGRQKAARLAPAIEHNHARDLFRQVMVIALLELRQIDRSGLHFLYPAIVWLCANRGYNLFPSAGETRFPNDLTLARGKRLDDVLQLANDGVIQATSDFGQALFAELTDRYYSIQALAIGTVELTPAFSFIFNSFPETGLETRVQQILFNSWQRLQLEQRRFCSIGVELRMLGGEWERPEGIDPRHRSHLMPGRMEDYLKMLTGGDQSRVEQIVDWFRYVVCNSGLLTYTGDLYYLSPRHLAIKIESDRPWLRCRTCARLLPEAVGDTCAGCLGQVIEAERDYLNARTGYYQDQIERARRQDSLEPFGLTAAEHTAQLNGNQDDSAYNLLEQYELRFQDIDPGGLQNAENTPIDILSCTTTMEVGIDIGALSGVALRNVPPHVSNYQQRAGRAGRRGRSVASVVTYAHGTSHDANFFAQPSSIITGPVRAPIVNIENQKILERHIAAYLIQRFFHDVVPDDTSSNSYRLFESLGSVGEFLNRENVCSWWEFLKWIDRNKAELRRELSQWAPDYCHTFGRPIPETAVTIEQSISRLQRSLEEMLPVEQYLDRSGLTDLEREMLEVRLDERLLESLITRAVLPRYAFPTDTVNLWVIQQRSTNGSKRSFRYQPQRDLGLALSEYAPTRTLTIDGYRYESAAIFSPLEPLPTTAIERRRSYHSCRDCSYVSLDAAEEVLASCPCCGSDNLDRSSFIRPSGFATDINEKPERDQGQTINYAGQVERARLEMQDPPGPWQLEDATQRIRTWAGPTRLAVVNKGQGSGFMICPRCGRSEPAGKKGTRAPRLVRNDRQFNHVHPLESGVRCAGEAVGPFHLGYQFPTDVLLMRLRADHPVRLGMAGNPRRLSQASRVALTSLIEAISIAAARELQIDDSELGGWWTPIKGAPVNEVQIYLYDQLAGGAGYAKTVRDSLEGVLNLAERLVRECDCSQSCYKCIRHYGNNSIHSSLDRRLALDLLRHLRTGEVPKLAEGDRSAALARLTSYLELLKIQFEPVSRMDGSGEDIIVTIPTIQIEEALLAERTGGKIRVDIHHPLVDPSSAQSPVWTEAEETGTHLVVLDAFDLLHNLPAALSRLGVSGKLPADNG
ncbi:MAG: DEAD/DEAH box helicase [Acidobacteria bacterium]|nr:DEAD/DEAH box helicase [Acidobacteriota bacterium]